MKTHCVQAPSPLGTAQSPFPCVTTCVCESVVWPVDDLHGGCYASACDGECVLCLLCLLMTFVWTVVWTAVWIVLRCTSQSYTHSTTSPTSQHTLHKTVFQCQGQRQSACESSCAPACWVGRSPSRIHASSRARTSCPPLPPSRWSHCGTCCGMSLPC